MKLNTVRYTGCTVYAKVENGQVAEYFLSRPKPINLTENDDSYPYVVNHGEGFDVLAERIFGNPRYWFVIAAINNKNDFWDLKAGETIILPTFDFLSKVNA